MTDNKKDPRQNEAATHEAERTRLYIDPKTDGIYYIDPETGEKITVNSMDDVPPDAKKIYIGYYNGLKISDLPPKILKDQLATATQALIKAFQEMGIFDAVGMNAALEIMRQNMGNLQALYDEIETLKPYLLEELQKPEYNGATISDLLNSIEIDGVIPPGHPLEKALQAARAAHEAEPGKVTVKRAETIDFPIDKVNSRIWRLLEKDTGGQLAFDIDFDTSRRGKKDSASVYYAIDFDNLNKNVKITKRLQPFDRRVYNAIAALFNAGNTIISLTQIYYHIGYTGRPGASDLEKIKDSVTKMLGAQIVIDNSQEAGIYNYPTMIYRGALLPVETGEIYDVNGKLTNAAIHLFREPPLVSFARSRNQITTINLSLLQSPINKTDSNILIDDYLIERISRAKNRSARKVKIKLRTLYEHTGMAGTTGREIKKRQRAPKTIEKYLKYYEKDGFIKSYTLDADSVEIFI